MMFGKKAFHRRHRAWPCDESDAESSRGRRGMPFRATPFHRHGRHGFAPGGGPPFDRPFRGGPFGDDPFGDGGGRRRQRRGDLKFVLLELLAEQPRHGYELIKAIEERYAGFYRPSPGSVYPTLQLLEDEGSVVGEPVDGKRVYTITDAGRKALADHQRRADESGRGWRGRRRGPSPELEPLRRSAMSLLGSVMEVARHGTAEQQRAALERLDAARREIYAILARDDSERLI